MIRRILVPVLMTFFMLGQGFADEHLDQAAAYFSQGNFKKSAKYAEKVLKREPDNIEAGIYLAESCSERGQANKAIGIYKDMLKRNPDNMDLVFRLGLVYNKAEYHQNAVDAYKQILAKDPNNVLGHYRLGLSYALCMDLSAAYSEYRILKPLDEKLARDLLQRIQTNN